MILLKIVKAMTDIILLPTILIDFIRGFFNKDRKEEYKRWLNIKAHIDALHKKSEQLIETAKIYNEIGMVDDSNACLQEADKILQTVRSILDTERSKMKS